MTHRTRTSAAAGAALVLVLPLMQAGCLSPVYLHRAAILEKVDGYIGHGQGDSARVLAEALCDSAAGTPEAIAARYRLGYLNVFYAKPRPDRARAISEFSRFVTECPDHRRAAEAKTWISVLKTMDTLAEQNRDYDERMHKVVRQAKGDSLKQALLGQERGALLDSIRNCYMNNDSLSARIRVLEEVIETIEKPR